jgi:hypothetical protein
MWQYTKLENVGWKKCFLMLVPWYIWVVVGIGADLILKIQVLVCSNVKLTHTGGWGLGHFSQKSNFGPPCAGRKLNIIGRFSPPRKNICWELFKESWLFLRTFSLCLLLRIFPTSPLWHLRNPPTSSLQWDDNKIYKITFLLFVVRDKIPALSS